MSNTNDWLHDFCIEGLGAKKSTASEKEQIESIVNAYAQQVGLDLIDGDGHIDDVKTASVRKNSIFLKIAKTEDGIKIFSNNNKDVTIVFESMLKQYYGLLSTSDEVIVNIKKSNEQSAIDMINEDPELMGEIENIIAQSGGHKSTFSIIDYIRQKLGDKVKMSDANLKEFIEKIKSSHLVVEKKNVSNIGLVGTEPSEESPLHKIQ